MAEGPPIRKDQVPKGVESNWLVKKELSIQNLSLLLSYSLSLNVLMTYNANNEK